MEGQSALTLTSEMHSFYRIIKVEAWKQSRAAVGHGIFVRCIPNNNNNDNDNNNNIDYNNNNNENINK